MPKILPELFRAAPSCGACCGWKRKFNRIQFNRWILRLNGALYIYPWKFAPDGQFALYRTRTLQTTCFKAQLGFFATYVAYTVWALIHTVSNGMDHVGYDIFGIHLVRALLGIAFSYWAHQIFLVYNNEHKLLYNFVQLSPGNCLNPK